MTPAGPVSGRWSTTSGLNRYRVLDRYLHYNAIRRRGLGRLAYLGKRAVGTSVGAIIPLWSRSARHATTPCDVLFIHDWERGPESVAVLEQHLKARGLSVGHHHRAGRLERLVGRMLHDPGHAVPLSWRLDAFYAGYLVTAYSPKVVISFQNYSALTACLRMACAGRAKVVNISHGVTPPGDESNMFDCDYYFMFGRGSLENAARKSIRIGATRVVLTGSFNVSPDFQLAPNRDRRTVVFFSQLSDAVLNSPAFPTEVKQRLVRNTHRVIEFARQHPELAIDIRLHPQERPERITALARGTDNVRILDASMRMQDALAPASLAIVMWSNAAIEAALLRRPVVVINDTEVSDDYLALERFFLPRARTAVDLGDRVARVFADYDRYLDATQAFVAHHLAHTRDSIPYMAGCIDGIAHGAEPFEYTVLEEELGGLKAAT